jgi:hypothetical protein
VVLTKTNKANASEPFVVRMEPKAPGESMTEWTSGERGKDMARQLGAVYALFRVSAGKRSVGMCMLIEACRCATT